jgi:hypothetical protein
MRRPTNPIVAGALFLLLGVPVFGEILDRIVVVIDDKFIVTLSDIRKERSIQVALGSNPGTDDDIVEALIERHLVEDQISQFLEIDVPEEAVTQRLGAIGNPPGVSTQDLRESLIGELRRRQFIIERFQQFIRVSDEEVQEYYNEVYVPEARRRGERILPLEEVAEQIRQNKIAEKTNDEVGSWLKELKRRSRIEKILK